MENLKLDVKIGDAAFSAEGPSELVRQQFDAFLQVVKGTPPASGQSEVSAKSLQPSLPESDFLNRIFEVDAKGLVSLRILPKTENLEPDALILILWGFLMMKNREEVVAVDLAAAARKSGLQVERLGRVIEQNSQYFSIGGTKKGRRYVLNNQGKTYAKGLSDGMLS